ncbi:outer membrane protein [Erythrobacter rubeus]|uniref:Outer membrane beta-barrel protein n=1 Tax=Erythrobacter rubeus TaxID=2760803 RepID=A0ABR8KQW5_9SPHN|nr:outer membrane beta-barrel protein [Erythrobacter rubeus]MBD2841935.1 outer membrane beta-barrel protein [Erythrobacter rubeus]
MKYLKFSALSAIACGAVAIPAAAQAQTDGAAEPYVGASIGYHDIGTDLPDDDGGIYGVVAGVDVPVGETIFVGAEGNFHFGDGFIDNEYGVAARLGVRVGERGKVYVRGGYQEVDFDFSRFAPVALPAGFDTTDGDYLVGAGADFGIGDGPLKLRVGIDTIAFDSTRVTGGVLFAF